MLLPRRYATYGSRERTALTWCVPDRVLMKVGGWWGADQLSLRGRGFGLAGLACVSRGVLVMG